MGGGGAGGGGGALVRGQRVGYIWGLTVSAMRPFCQAPSGLALPLSWCLCFMGQESTLRHSPWNNTRPKSDNRHPTLFVSGIVQCPSYAYLFGIDGFWRMGISNESGRVDQLINRGVAESVAFLGCRFSQTHCKNLDDPKRRRSEQCWRFEFQEIETPSVETWTMLCFCWMSSPGFRVCQTILV